MEDRAMQRRRIKHTTTFEERLAEEAQQFREAAEKEPVGSTARELLLRRVRKAETASRNDWLASPGRAPPKMIGYRVYVMGSDGHIQRRIDIFCKDDEAAKERAEKLVDGHDVELWQLDRRIGEFKAKE
jgi:hypothetical protein